VWDKVAGKVNGIIVEVISPHIVNAIEREVIFELLGASSSVCCRILPLWHADMASKPESVGW
jgi:hypothetical protein